MIQEINTTKYFLMQGYKTINELLNNDNVFAFGLGDNKSLRGTKKSYPTKRTLFSKCDRSNPNHQTLTEVNYSEALKLVIEAWKY